MNGFAEQGNAQKMINNFQENFTKEAYKYRDKPVNQRQCQDICCTIFFIICFLTFLIYSAVSINTMVSLSDLSIDAPNDSFLSGITTQELQTFATIVLACFGGAIFISSVMCGFLFIFAEIMVYFMAGMSFIGLVAGAIYLVAATQLRDFATYYFFLAFFYLIFILNMREYLTKAAILMKTISAFIIANRKILFLVLIVLIYSLIVVFLWTLGLYSFCVLYAKKQLSYGGFAVSSVFWAFLLVFFNFYFYYTCVFLTSYSLALWFYQKQEVDYVGTPLKHMVAYHIGTITFASLAITFMYILKFILYFARWNSSEGLCGMLGTICTIIVCCCISSMETLVEVLNSYAIAISALTGESYWNSAWIAGHLGFDDYEAFCAFSYAGHIIRFGGTICTSIIPTIVGAIILTSNLTNQYLEIVGILLIMFCTTIIGMTILQVFLESIHTLFIMYRFDTELQERGYQVQWVQQYGQQMEKGFDEAFVGQIKKKPRPQWKKRTTIVVYDNGQTQVYKQKVLVQPEQVSQQEISHM